ncbi:MAG: efflux RND transporter periplasmic adaptor subunit [Planctomycetota bacterium]
MSAASGDRRRGKGLAGVTAVVVGVVLVLAGVAGWTLFGGGEDNEPAGTNAIEGAQWYRVVPQSFDLTVVASGELQAAEQTEVKSEVEGRVAIVEIVEEGTFVEKGEVLVRLESSNIAEKVEQEELNVETARTEMTTAEQELEIERNESASEIRDAEVKLQLAELDLAKWEEGEVVQKRRELQLALEKAERRLERAKEDLAYSQQLYDEKFISFSELDGDIVEEIEAIAALETAKLDIDVYEKYAFQRDKKENETSVDQARDALENTKRNAEQSISGDQARLTSRIRRYRIRDERLTELKEQLEATTIKAPEAGLVIYKSSVGPRWQRQDPIRQGRQVGENETILYLPDTRSMVAAVRVHEALLSDIAEGQPATVTIDASSGPPLTGEVASVAVMAEDGGWLNPNLREYLVQVSLPQEAAASLKPGMRASSEIIVGRVDESLAVPLQAVHAEGETNYVYVDAGRGVRRQPVTLGASSEAFVEIADGLSEGDRVLLRDPRPGEVTDS